MGTATIKARRLAFAALLAFAAAGLVQCGGSPVGPPPPSAAALQSISLNPTSVAGGNTVQGTATLTTGAPSGGANVTLSSNNTQVATVPSSVTVPQGSATATFTVTALVVGSTQTATISGTYLNVTQTAPLSVTGQTPHADFVVTADPDTTVSAGQCAATQSGSAQKLRCTFDASASTPSSAITEYRWTLPGTSTPQLGMKLKDAMIPCGTFPNVATDKDVTLVIVTPSGTATVTKSVTFVKAGAC
jgi:hypothetical protein